MAGVMPMMFLTLVIDVRSLSRQIGNEKADNAGHMLRSESYFATAKQLKDLPPNWFEIGFQKLSY
ncbi:hypothetical protein [Sphingomonas pituitosa]|uniref:hypothetical protein n=1 Tax=Sphingomonas pituitosa TaxID=99597 RepID=UPI0012EDE106|nr:hypothetical protein [Sphingomonas pituitosa]